MQQKEEAKAVGKYIRISPTKVRRVLDQIRGRSYQEALIIFQYMLYKAYDHVWQVLSSADANVENNLTYKKENLRVKTVFANPGPTLRRFRPRAQGKGFPIRKPTCHITVILEESTKN